jgi:serine phosphatase RsbU (regulator of sigma subunit)
MNQPVLEPLDPIARLAAIFRPQLRAYRGEERLALVNDVIGVLLTLPLSFVAILWLLAASDWSLIPRHWPTLLAAAAFSILLNRWSFYMITDFGVRGGGSYGNAASSLDGVIRWSAAFLFGPLVLWIDACISLFLFLYEFRPANNAKRRWVALRTLTFNITTACLFPLISLSIYRAWGGVFPLAGLNWRTVLLGSGVIVVQFLLENLFLWTAYLGYTLLKMRRALTPKMLFSMAQLLAFGLLLPFATNLFAAPLAGIYMEHGWPIALIFAIGLALMAWLAHHMTQAMEHNRLQAVQLEKLEALGRAILSAPPDNSTLADLLTEHATAMFTYVRMAIWLEPERWLLKQPKNWDANEINATRQWLMTHPEPLALTARDAFPWQSAKVPHRPMVLTPILAVEGGQPLGGIYVELATLGQPHTQRSLQLLLPTAQALAAQVASALHQANVYESLLAHQKTQTELEFARHIQSGFLPASLPHIPGWQLAASLEPARQMAGDFYDVIALPSGRLGLLIADVADKGVGPALYMALSRTLIRTFAVQYEDQPERVFQAANERILQDAGESLFVTAFYGVLDPTTGQLTYVNAGHNPPWVLRCAEGVLEPLNKPALPLGIDEAMRWKSFTTTLAPGDGLFLYTDGASDASNATEEMFGMERLAEAVRNCRQHSADSLRSGVLVQIRNFAGDAPQFDDITLMIVKREK